MAVTNDIKSLLPHREPFLFVDEIVSCDDNGSVSIRKFTEDDFFFKGHFPEYPVVPGVILCETMAQAGGAALSFQKKVPDGSLFFFAIAMSFSSVSFVAVPLPMEITSTPCLLQDLINCWKKRKVKLTAL